MRGFPTSWEERAAAARCKQLREVIKRAGPQDLRNGITLIPPNSTSYMKHMELQAEYRLVLGMYINPKYEGMLFRTVGYADHITHAMDYARETARRGAVVVRVYKRVSNLPGIGELLVWDDELFVG